MKKQVILRCSRCGRPFEMPMYPDPNPSICESCVQQLPPGPDLRDIIKRLAEVYTVDTDQAALIRLVHEAQEVMRHGPNA